MADTKIRITSNPYERTLSFDRWDDGWQAIDSTTAPRSGLIKADVLNGFLPFKAKQIVDLVFTEYGGGTTIVFEGPGDEYEDLRSTCSDSCYGGKLQLVYGEEDLADADDILPEIVNVFGKVETLLEGTIENDVAVSSDMAKFIDVSKDQVPICVIGNYSAGKSTFINALIGYEMLPSGTEALTAKVFKINPSSKGSFATISFGEGDEHYELQFDSDGIRLDKSTGNPSLLKAIASHLRENCSMNNYIDQVNCTLQYLNEYSPATNRPSLVIPDLIEISAPCNPRDPWMGNRSFVIFDTPGSNSATDVDHSRVLKEQMEGLSDGLILYLAKSDTLNTNDNDALCDFARSIDAMDDRFTMVVVNCADQGFYPLTGFSQREEQRKLDQAVCRRLEPQGVFYVSSLIALGSKNGGVFRSEGDTNYYNRMKSRFSDQQADDYTELYRCNIMPAHKKKQSVADSSACENRVLANSGLRCIESEIELFAKRYSAYNKCNQAKKLLERVIDAATTILNDEKEQLEAERLEKEQELKREKAEITQALGSCGREQEAQALDDYEEQVVSHLGCEHWYISMDKLKSKESSFTQESSEEHGLETVQNSERDARKAARENLASRIRGATKTKSMDSLRDAFEGAMEDYGKVLDRRAELSTTQREVNRQTADQLLASICESFTKSFGVMTSDIEVRSKSFWKERSEAVREALYDTATESTVLSEEKRREIGDVIISFQPLALTADAEAIFVKSKLEETLQLLNFVIYRSDRLDLRKVRKTYNDGINASFDMTLDMVYEGHTKSFLAWLDNLMAAINSNIESYNPVLEEHVQSIRDKSEQIRIREEKLAELSKHLDTVSRLIGWRKRG